MPEGRIVAGDGLRLARVRADFFVHALFATLALGAWLCVGAGSCQGQEKPKNKPLFLVARKSIQDPYFAHSVVLMVPIQGEPLIVGLIVNKPAPPPLVKLLQQTPIIKDHTSIAYFGGPVDVTDLAAAFHAAKPPKDAIPLYDDVYLSFDADFILNRLEDRKQTADMRLFLGRSQWAPEQLQGEALMGSWYSLRAEGSLIFDREPDHLWDRLHARAQPGLSTRNRTVRPAEDRMGTLNEVTLALGSHRRDHRRLLPGT